MTAAHAAPDDEQGPPSVSAVPDVADTETVKVAAFKGKTFALNVDMHPMAVLEFAEVMSSADEDPLGAGKIMRFVTEMIAPSDRVAFRSHCWEQRADVDDLIGFLSEDASDEVRPTVRPGNFSPGPESTSPKSGSSSDVKVSTAFPGRPDLQSVERRILAAS
jgi:hypothetical protein